MKFLKLFDLHPTPYSFEEEGDKNFHTKFSITISFLSYILILIVCGFFGYKFFTNTDPLVNVGIKKIDKSLSKINMSDIPLMFSFYNYTHYIENPDFYFRYNARLVTYDIEGNLFEETINLNTKKCVLEEISPAFRTVFENGFLIPEMICFEFPDSVYVFNDFNEMDLRYFFIDVLTCNIPKDSVLDKSECNNIFEDKGDLFVDVYTIQSFVDPSNYTNPISYRASTTEFALSPMSLINSSFRLFYDFLITDSGKLIENNQEIKFLESSQLTYQMIINDEISFEKIIFSLSIRGDVYSQFIVRKYLKIQEVSAQCGGIINLIIVIGNIFCIFIIHFILKFLYTIK